jgi:hypothetical protein
MRVAIATRSMNDCLYRISGDLLALEQLGLRFGSPVERHRITGTDNVGYFQRLLDLDADWVVSIDEDAFLISPDRLAELIATMDREGYAACGMPDGGVVRIRYHNPLGCNAFFNAFDLRKARPAWHDWPAVLATTYRPQYERLAPAFACRTPLAFDHFQAYYSVFFRLVEAGERILYLDAQEWQDGVSTLLKDPSGEALLVHCWYTRSWDTSYHTRRRYLAAIQFARQAQGLPPLVFSAAMASASQAAPHGSASLVAAAGHVSDGPQSPTAGLVNGNGSARHPGIAR